MIQQYSSSVFSTGFLCADACTNTLGWTIPLYARSRCCIRPSGVLNGRLLISCTAADTSLFNDVRSRDRCIAAFGPNVFCIWMTCFKASLSANR